MAALQTIRSKGALLVGVLGLALFAFIAEEFFRSLGLATRLHELQIGQDTIDEIVRRFNERGSRLGEAGNITGDVTRRILELCK